MLDHGAAGLLNRGTGPAAVEAGEEPAGKGSRPALPTSLRRNYIHATPILRGLGCNCNVAKPSGQRWGPRHRIFVEHEVDVHGRAVSFMAVSLVLGFLVAPSPRSSTKRMVSLIARPSWLPTSARRRINSSESRRLMRWLVLARGAREPDEK